MKDGVHPGLTATLSWQVGPQHVIHLGADGPGPGAVVFATPSMINLMEHAALNLLQPYCDPGETSVGVRVNIEHLTATPIGVAVTAEARVTQVEGRLVDFEVTASDAVDVIGKGTHQRAVIRTAKFAERLKEKVSKLPGGSMTPVTIAANTGELPSLPTLEVDVDGAVANVTLNRPAKNNAVNQQMTADWEAVNSWLAGHPELRVVTITGSGNAFCSGDDVPEVGTISLDAARELSLRQARMYLAWEQLPQVFVASIQGYCLGGGLVLANACDLRIAAVSSKFGMPEILLGWPPGYGVAQLTASVGKSRAMELCLMGQQITARQALEWGLVHEVVPPQRLNGAVADCVKRLLALPKDALTEVKRLVHLDEGMTPKIAYLADTAAYIRSLALPAAQEGIAAFREKRPPRY